MTPVRVVNPAGRGEGKSAGRPHRVQRRNGLVNLGRGPSANSGRKQGLHWRVPGLGCPKIVGVTRSLLLQQATAADGCARLRVSTEKNSRRSAARCVVVRPRRQAGHACRLFTYPPPAAAAAGPGQPAHLHGQAQSLGQPSHETFIGVAAAAAQGVVDMSDPKAPSPMTRLVDALKQP